MKNEFFAEIVKIFESDHPFRLFISNVVHLFSELWKYKIFTTADKQSVLIGNLVIGIILLFFGIRLVKKINALFKKKLNRLISEDSTVNILERLSYYFLMLIMVIFILDISNVPLTIFTVIGTTLALGIGLGSQNIVNNFISGIIIMIEQPIKVGDIVEVKNIAGKVTNIGARCTSITTGKNINILVPNSIILQDAIINWTYEDTILRISFEITVSNNHSIEEIEQIFLHVLKNHIFILDNPVPQVIVKELCSNGYFFEISFWIDLALNAKSSIIINDINRVLDPLLREKNIKIIDKVPCSLISSNSGH